MVFIFWCARRIGRDVGTWKKLRWYSVFSRAAAVGMAARTIFHADLPHSASSTSFRSHGARLSRRVGPSPSGEGSGVDWWRRRAF